MTIAVVYNCPDEHLIYKPVQEVTRRFLYAGVSSDQVPLKWTPSLRGYVICEQTTYHEEYKIYGSYMTSD